MGLSALGLESHHEYGSEVPVAEDSARNSIQEIYRDGDASDKEGATDEEPDMNGDDYQNDQEQMILDAIGDLIFSEIDDALNIMSELKHPEITGMLQEEEE